MELQQQLEESKQKIEDLELDLSKYELRLKQAQIILNDDNKDVCGILLSDRSHHAASKIKEIN